MSASWPLRQPILFMQKVICPCANCPRQTYMHTHIISSAHPSCSVLLGVSFCLCLLPFSLTPTEWYCQGYLACLKNLFGFSGLYSLYACFVLLHVFRCFVGCLCSVGFLVLTQTQLIWFKFPHSLSFLYISMESDLIGRKWPSENQPSLL